MPRALLLLGLMVARCGLGADAPAPRVAPNYTAASIVNSADNLSGVLAPNTIGTIYGTNLAYGTAALTASDVQGGVLPIVLGDSETRCSSAITPRTCIMFRRHRSTSWFLR